jgi:hypothetical protein
LEDHIPFGARKSEAYWKLSSHGFPECFKLVFWNKTKLVVERFEGRIGFDDLLVVDTRTMICPCFSSTSTSATTFAAKL